MILKSMVVTIFAGALIYDLWDLSEPVAVASFVASSATALWHSFMPSVSIVIPFYNEERWIGRGNRIRCGEQKIAPVDAGVSSLLLLCRECRGYWPERKTSCNPVRIVPSPQHEPELSCWVI